MSNTRAKFVCQSKTENTDGITNVIFYPVTAEHSKENESFWNATPAGQITLSISNPKAVDNFVQGEEYYVDFTHAGKEK